MKNRFSIEKELWREKAACKGMELTLFFPEKERQSNSSQKLNDKIKNICKKCAVQTDCLSYAIDNEIEYGIWGGFSSRERRELNNMFELDKAPMVFYNLIVNKTMSMIRQENVKTK